MGRGKNPSCQFCRSAKVIKHGRTSTGNPRFRCRNCGRTWVLEKNDPVRPEIHDITEAYLSGRTCRDLVSIYHSSPLRINQKIREFLEGCPGWEEYIDVCTPRHEPRLVNLIGRSFSCACNGSRNNKMFLALAVDALSTVVLGFQIARAESRQVWLTLLDRLNCRGMICPSFMSNGSRPIEDAVHTVYPYSSIRINYHRAFRDKELQCCISRLPINNKLINDAVKLYNTLDNNNLMKYLRSQRDRRMQDILFGSQEDFIRRIKERFDNKNRIRTEGLTSAFQTRFEKFHMLKDDPFPVINGWIARWMLKRTDMGFSRLSLYRQIPSSTSFKDFSCGSMPRLMDLDDDSPLLKTFVIEIAARGLQLPVISTKCEMKLDKCSLF